MSFFTVRLLFRLSLEFLEKSQLVGKEAKVFLLNQIIEFQQSTGRKLMVRWIIVYLVLICCIKFNFWLQVVYDFLSEYLESWDGIQYSDQIHQLLADAPFLPYTGMYLYTFSTLIDSAKYWRKTIADLYELFLRVLEDQFHFSPPSTRFKIINTCRLLINNLVTQ